jgi:hypothetical protein
MLNTKLLEPEFILNTRLVIILKWLYFILGTSASTWGRFSTVYYIERGLSTSQIGIIGNPICFVFVCHPFFTCVFYL